MPKWCQWAGASILLTPSLRDNWNSHDNVKMPLGCTDSINLNALGQDQEQKAFSESMTFQELGSADSTSIPAVKDLPNAERDMICTLND